MPEGYTRGVPDPGFWMQQVYSGIQYRKRYAREEKWTQWREYYRGEWKPGILPVNLYYTMVRTVVPRVYFRNPSVSVQPRQPGFLGIALAQLIQRIDNSLIERMGVKTEMKRIVQDGFMFGAGFGKLGFGAQFTPTPEWGETGQPISKAGERFEYRDNVFKNMPWFSRVSPADMIVPDGLRTWEDARWVAHWIRRPLDDVLRDPRFENTKDIRPTGMAGSVGRRYHEMHLNMQKREYVEMVDLVEVRDKKLAKVFVLAPTGIPNTQGRVLYHDDDEYLINGAFPHFPLIFNEDDEVFWGVPDSQILEPYQMEINEIRTQAMKHRRLSLIKLLYNKDMIHVDDVQKMLSEDVLAAIPVQDDVKNAVLPVQVANIPVDLAKEIAQVLQDVRETVGFSRNQMGEFNSKTSDTTATEAQIVSQAAEIRVDERRDLVADMLVKMVESMNTLLFRHWDVEEVVQVSGPGGVPLWVQFRPEMIDTGAFTLKVDPDSSIPETKDMREQKAILRYSILKTNPMVDPEKLTKYILTEFQGTQFDDMMRQLPIMQEQPEGPISPEEYGGIIQQSLTAGGPA